MKKIRIQILIVIIGILIFSSFNGLVHLFDWDENNFAEISREMIVTNNYWDLKIDFNNFYEKPPFFFWLQALSMKIFGINEFSARFPNTIAGILTLLLIFITGKKYYNEKFGLIWVLSYVGSFLPLLYFKSGIIDPWFNFFIISGIIYTINYINSKKIKYLIFSSLLIGLGILTKGQVALIIFLMSFGVYILIKKFKYLPKWYDLVIFFIGVLLLGGSWFIFQILKGDINVVKEFIKVQIDLMTQNVASHGQPFYYHPIVLIIGVFPSSIFALNYLFKNKEYGNERQKDFSLWMKITFWCVLILFSIVKTKIIHYSSMCYFGITFFATQFFFNMSGKDFYIKQWQKIVLTIIGCIYGIILLIFPFFDKLKKYFAKEEMINDMFTLGNLQADGKWSGWEFISGLIFVFLFIYSLFFLKKKHKKIIVLYISSIILCLSFLLLYVPKIERYSQRIYLDFAKLLKGKDVYYNPLNMVSYGYLFYIKKQPSKFMPKEWYLNGNIDKDCYFFSRNHNEKEILDNNKNLIKISEKNGFVFYCRLKQGGEIDNEILAFFNNQ